MGKANLILNISGDDKNDNLFPTGLPYTWQDHANSLRSWSCNNMKQVKI